MIDSWTRIKLTPSRPQNIDCSNCGLSCSLRPDCSQPFCWWSFRPSAMVSHHAISTTTFDRSSLSFYFCLLRNDGSQFSHSSTQSLYINKNLFKHLKYEFEEYIPNSAGNASLNNKIKN